MEIKSFTDFIKDKYKNYNYPTMLPKLMINKIGLGNLFEEDILEYEKYLQRVEKLKTIPKYSL